MRSLLNWFTRWFTGKPHLYVGGEENPYMKRWFVIPRNPWLNIYLHKFVRDDDDRAMHDHPWWFLSLVIWGSYRESLLVPTGGGNFIMERVTENVRRFGSIAFRKAESRHIVRLPKRILSPDYWEPIPCWTLVITGPRTREWGFWCPKGFVHWKDFVAETDHGNIGKGCGD